MPAVPKTLGIIGAGAVGVEFASIFNRFGSKVTILEMLPRLVPVEDEEISKELEKHFKKIGIRTETGAKAENIRKNGNSVTLTATLANGNKEEMEFEKLLIAVGRKPNTDGVGLENTKAELDRGFVKVDGYQRTAEPGLYAIGDIVAGTPQLAHVATAEGMVAVGHIAGKPVRPINRNRIPGATYTDPGIGSVGLSEAQAKAQGFEVKIGKFPFAGNSKATILGQARRLREGDCGREVRGDSGRPHHRAGGVRADRGSSDGDGSRGYGRHDDADHSCAPDDLRSDRRGVPER